MHAFRLFFYAWLPLIGGALLMLSETLLTDFPQSAIIYGVSLALLILGIWRMLLLSLPKRKRRFSGLRDEIDAFLLHARQLNDMAHDARQATDADYPQAMLDLKQAMHDSVERMAAVAGVPQAMAPAATPQKSDKQRNAHTAVT